MRPRHLLRRTGHAGPDGPWVPVGAGVHTGRLWFGTVGEGNHVEITVLGDVVNTTARLASAAESGEVLVSVDAARAAGLDDSALEHRSLELKGKEAPTEVVSVRIGALTAMTFAVGADAYEAFMGRYSRGLSAPFADFAGIVAGQRALDVGCGPGILTEELVARLGADAVAAVDPSSSFVEAARAKLPGVTVAEASAEALPFPDEAFDATLAQLVVHFMPDPVAGLREMRRVTRPGGVVAASVWDHAGGQGPLGVFWRAAHEIGGEVVDESGMPGAREGHLAELFEAAGLGDIATTVLTVSREHPSFDDWWEPYTLGVGPAGAFVARLGRGRARRASRAMPRAAPRGSVHGDRPSVDRQGSRLGVEHLAEGAGERWLRDATAEIGVREEDRLARAVHIELLLRHPDAGTEHDALGRRGRPRSSRHRRRSPFVSGGPRQRPPGTARSARRSVERPRAQRTPPHPIQAMATSSP